MTNSEDPSLFSFEGEREDDLNWNTPFPVDAREKLATQWARLKPIGFKDVRATFNFMRLDLSVALLPIKTVNWIEEFYLHCVSLLL